MAKGQMRGNREVRKPKAVKTVPAPVSATVFNREKPLPTAGANKKKP